MNANDSVSAAFLEALHKREWPENVHFILAVSGGIDSMTLAHLFASLTPHSTTWGHVNFGLRGMESEGDALFVQQEGARYGVEVHVDAPETQSHAQTYGKSIQMAARDLRYAFFNTLAENLKNQGKHPVLVTAHHADDQAETLLQNLVRGKHPLSWAGMEGGRNLAFRPLLKIRKSAILDYARRHEIAFREDASNSSDYYQRNFIRHRIMPLLEELNPSAAEHLNQAAEEAGRWLELAQTGSKMLLESGRESTSDGARWCISDLRETANALAFEIHCSDLGFRDLPALRNHLAQPRTGTLLESRSHELLFDREYVILRRKTDVAISNEPKTPTHLSTEVSKSGEHPATSHTWETAEELVSACSISTGLEQIELIPADHDGLKSPEMGRTACLFDADKLEYPVVLRKWRPGDRIEPLGLGGEQKVKEILINRKVNRFAKENTWVLADQRNVACILFHTLSERIKVTPASVRIVQIRRR